MKKSKLKDIAKDFIQCLDWYLDKDYELKTYGELFESDEHFDNDTSYEFSIYEDANNLELSDEEKSQLWEYIYNLQIPINEQQFSQDFDDFDRDR